METKSIGTRLKEIRKSKDMTLAAFSVSLGVTHGYLSRVENDKTILGQETFVSLYKQFCVNVNWLLTGEGEMFLPSKGVDQTDSLEGQQGARALVVLESRPQTGEKGICNACGQPFGVKGLLEAKEEVLRGKDAQIALQEKLLRKAEEEVESLKKDRLYAVDSSAPILEQKL